MFARYALTRMEPSFCNCSGFERKSIVVSSAALIRPEKRHLSRNSLTDTQDTEGKVTLLPLIGIGALEARLVVSIRLMLCDFAVFDISCRLIDPTVVVDIFAIVNLECEVEAIGAVEVEAGPKPNLTPNLPPVFASI